MGCSDMRHDVFDDRRRDSALSKGGPKIIFVDLGHVPG